MKPLKDENNGIVRIVEFRGMLGGLNVQEDSLMLMNGIDGYLSVRSRLIKSAHSITVAFILLRL